MKRFLCAAIVGTLILGCGSKIYSQNVGINSDGSAPNANAMLDVASPATGNGKGMLIPRMTEAQRTTASAALAGGLLDGSGNLRGGACQGLLVYQTNNTQGFYYNTSATSTPTWILLIPGISDSAGNNNTGIGYQALNSNTEGYHNTASGYRALYSNTTGFSNTAYGYSALRDNNNNFNTAIGAEALLETNGTSPYGIGNTALGCQAGDNNITGYYNTFIGYTADASSSNFTNATAIGYGAFVTASNQVMIGNVFTTSLYCQGAYAAETASTANMFVNSDGQIMRSTSSARYKKDIVDIEVDTSKIYQLRPVSFTSKNNGERYFGLIAEEVAATIPELAEFAKASDVIPGRTDDELVPDAVKYPILSVLMLEEMKKLKAENEDLKSENEILKADIREIKLRLGME